jgi:hypothetical protein
MGTPHRPRILWSSSHYEFVLSDDYYFSTLAALVAARADVVESDHPLDLDWLKTFDCVVFNYPERPFTTKEVRKILRYLNGGGRVVISAYYANEDGVAAVASRLTAPLGISFNFDRVETADEGLMVTARTVREAEDAGISPNLTLRFPCSCSLAVSGGAFPVARAGDAIVCAAARHGAGALVAIGTSVFWDNFSIGILDNKLFSLSVLGLCP